MRIGFSVKELSEILGIDARRVGQSVDPAMEKLARLWMRNPTKTMEFLLDTVTTLRRLRRSELDMSEAEIEERKCRLQCQYDTPAGGCLKHKADVADGRAAHPLDKQY